MKPMYSVLNPRLRRQFTLDLDRLEKTYIIVPFAKQDTTLYDMISTASDKYPGTGSDDFSPDAANRPQYIAWARRYHATRHTCSAAAFSADNKVRLWHFNWKTGGFSGEMLFDAWAPYCRDNQSDDGLEADDINEFYNLRDLSRDLAAIFRLALDWGQYLLDRDGARGEMRRVVEFLATDGHNQAATCDLLRGGKSLYEKELGLE